ncbi:DUF1109 domain-containing protein [Aurantiacibacter aquimixticola]|nr:DUF1109 domain-containing protein [Aurantiacibacter aquimixticola]
MDNILDQLASEGAAPARGVSWRFAAPMFGVIAACGLGVGLALDGAFASVETDGMGPLTVKWGFSLTLLLLAAAALFVLGKPGRPTTMALLGVAAPFVPIAALFLYETVAFGPQVAGDTWAQCLAAMLLMSPIAFIGAVLGMRAFAPTNLRRAGLVAGLFGGAVAMTAYAPFCPERGMGYMALFYILPILAMAGLGWLLGPRLLRW